MHFLNDRRPWFGTLHGSPMPIRELVDRGTLTWRSAATFAWAIEHGASVFVAAGPPGAGKSILATALLEFLDDDAQIYVTSGARDPLQLPPGTKGPLYLLVNELSYHMPVYLSGAAAQWAFGLLRTGAHMIGTLHARSAAEAVQMLSFESEVPREDLAAPFVLAALSAWRSEQGVVRRVTEIGFLPPHVGNLELLVNERHPEEVHFGAMARWSGTSESDLHAEIERRAKELAAFESPR